MSKPIREITGKRTTIPSFCMKSSIGAVHLEPEKIAQRWTECTGQLFDDDRLIEDVSQQDISGSPTERRT